MQRTPIERLRNILSPFITLVSLLQEKNKIEFENSDVNGLYNESLKTSIENSKEVHRQLTIADNIMLSLDECDLIVSSLSTTYDDAVKMLGTSNITDIQRQILEKKKQKSLQLKIKIINFASLTKPNI